MRCKKVDTVLKPKVVCRWTEGVTEVHVEECMEVTEVWR